MLLQVPGLDVEASNPRLPSLVGAVTKLKNAVGAQDEQAVSAAVGELESLALSWFRASQWYYQEATECVAYYNGAQWGYYDRSEGRYITNPEPRSNDQVRVVVNVVKPVVDRATGIVTQEPPIFDVSASTSEGHDSGAQKAASAINERNWRHHQCDHLYRLTARKSFTSGTDFLHVEWDPTAGPPGQQDAQAALSPEGVGPPPPAGDIRIVRVPPESVAFDPNAKTCFDGEGIVIRERFGIARLRALYPDKWETVQPGRHDDDDEMRSAEDADRHSPTGSFDFSDTGSEDQEATRFTFYLARCPGFPLGAWLSITTSVLLHGPVPNPIYPRPDEPSKSWPIDNWPLFAVICDARDHNPWGRGRTVDMMEPQVSFNGVVSKTLQHIAKVANAKVILPKNLDVEWTDEIGQEIRVSRLAQGGQIAYVNPPQLPNEYFMAWDKLKVEMEYLAGVSAASNGQVPFADTSGRAMVAAQEGDYGRLKPFKEELDRVWGRVCRYKLFLFQRHADEKRMVDIVGENGVTSIVYLNRADLASEIDLRVQNDQSIPRDPTKRMLWLSQFMQTLSQAPDENSRQALFQMARVKDFEPMLETLQPDLVKARRMADNIMIGKPTPAFEDDDPLVFKAELSRLAKRPEFEIKVERERGETGVSLTELLHRASWIYYTNRAAMLGTGMPMPGMAPAQPQPQQGPPA